MKLAELLKLALDELRMQMLGMQVLFGFEFHALFQDGFPELGASARAATVAALIVSVATIGVLVAVPCQHRLTEAGEATERLRQAATRSSQLALLLIAVTIGLDAFVAVSRALSQTGAIAFAVLLFALSMGMWYGLGWAFKGRRTSRQGGLVSDDSTPVHAKIEQMLTEARVILPGAQALLGFQLIVVMTKAFSSLAPSIQTVHVFALTCVALSIVLLIAPAAIHRLAFDGRDDPRFHRIGTVLISLALGPLAVGICCDLFVAMSRVLTETTARGIAWAAFAVLIALWYALPLALRQLLRSGSPPKSIRQA